MVRAMINTELIEQSLRNGKGLLSQDGALMVKTGICTGRSTKERYVVKHPEIEQDIDWGGVNKAVSPEWAETYFTRLQAELDKNSVFRMNGFVGCFPIRVHSSSPWHIAFAKNMFREDRIETLKGQVPDELNIEVFHHPEVQPKDLGLEWEHDRAIIVDPHKLRVGICGTAYAGEIKKSAFSLCNYLFPRFNLLPMHSSANCLREGDSSCVLFGLSGTGKTTLSADPKRHLIGDDEIVWSSQGLSNLEGGCYAKLIKLDSEKEPDIYRAANRFGSILENVCFNPETREIDFCDESVTENTRASYPIGALDKVYKQDREAQPPKTIVFLTADAFGALPAVARLDEWQAQYHFISGYTAKVAGTEIGVTEPQATFSSCFGAPFMPRPASVYGELLAKLVKEHGATVWLLNTGWTNGGYGQGERFPIPVSRDLLTAIQSGELNQCPMKKHPVFGFDVPTEVPGVDSQFLNIPEGEAVNRLAAKFIENAKSKGASFTDQVIDLGGPRQIN